MIVGKGLPVLKDIAIGKILIAEKHSLKIEKYTTNKIEELEIFF